MMNGEAKITGVHRDRLALIYLRQSSMAQVREHTESTTRQYGLAEEAVRLGWARLDVLVIDTDLGVSGRWGVARAGFTELVRRVCCGEVGAIFGIEISRLARSNAEVARLMEFAAITETLLIDADGVYDPGDVNDRMLLGMKSTIGEVELHVMAQRLQASKRAAAERGELQVYLKLADNLEDFLTRLLRRRWGRDRRAGPLAERAGRADPHRQAALGPLHRLGHAAQPRLRRAGLLRQNDAHRSGRRAQPHRPPGRARHTPPLHRRRPRPPRLARDTGARAGRRGHLAAGPAATGRQQALRHPKQNQSLAAARDLRLQQLRLRLLP